jgi:hypothetical protein
MNNFRRTVSIALITVAVLAAAADISGKWHFVLATPGGDREESASLAVSGDNVTGKFGAADIKGTFKDGALELSFPYESAEVGATAPLTFKGKMEDGKLTGTWVFAEYSGTFAATREP